MAIASDADRVNALLHSAALLSHVLCCANGSPWLPVSRRADGDAQLAARVASADDPPAQVSALRLLLRSLLVSGGDVSAALLQCITHSRAPEVLADGLLG